MQRLRGPPRILRSARVVAAAVLVVSCAAACGLDEGERFGRAGARPGLLRVHLLDEPTTFDPAHARTPVERGLARELFAALVEVDAMGAAGRTTVATPGLAERWELVDGRLRVTLRDEARFSDGAPITAEDVVWSWRRALRPSTGAADLTSLEVIAGGRELARRALLRVDSDGARGRPPPYALYRDGPGDAAVNAALPPYAAVRVVDTNARAPCCDAPVALRRSPDEGAPAAGSLLPGEAAVIIAVRDVTARSRAVTSWFQLRAPSGAAGWARADEVKAHIPAIGLSHVVDRAGDGVGLRAGPDEDAPARATLADDDLVEVLERPAASEPASEPGALARVIDLKSGRAGWLPRANLDDTVRERRWYLVESVADASRAWLPEEELVFDPGLLDARALDARTLDVGLAAGVAEDDALRAFAEPVMRPVSARLVEAWGTAWTQPARVITSGPFHLAEHAPGTGVVLVRSPASAFAPRARVERVELVVLENRTSALHLYRAGLVDAILDGALPPDLHTTLSRARDHVPGAHGGALIAPEVVGLSPAPLTLRDVEVRP